MRKIVINDNCILFQSFNELLNFGRNDLKNILYEERKKYKTCVVYNYFEIKNSKKIIKDYINRLKFVDQKKIGARNCHIKEINRNEKKDFLNENHIQGTAKSNITIGAYYKNMIIAIMLFNTKNDYRGSLKNGECELVRFTTKRGYIISGIFSKLLKYYIKKYNPKIIKSFADLKHSNSDRNIYLLNNFKKTKVISPKHSFYLKDKPDKLYHRLSFGNKFKKNKKYNKKEKEEILKKLHTVWDCGKIKYELHIDEKGDFIFGYVYKLTNIINNKTYIGQTIRSVNVRFNEHENIKNNIFTSQNIIKLAIKKYGFESFKKEIIDTAKTIEELNEKEIYYIKLYDSTNKKKGYNLHLGGRNAIPTKETRKKMSKSGKGKKKPKDWSNGASEIKGTELAKKKYGRKKTEEEKSYLSLNSPKYWEGKKRDPETIKKATKTRLKKGNKNEKKVYLIDIKTKEIVKEYRSAGEASRIEKISDVTMRSRCQRKSIIKGILHTYNKNEAIN